MSPVYLVFVKDNQVVTSIYPQSQPSIGALEKDVDGYYHYWVSYAVPTRRNGYFPAWVLRAIADELDRLNKPWDDELKAYFSAQLRDIQQFKVVRSLQRTSRPCQ